MLEPEIVGFGRNLVGRYPVKEYRESLTRAFRANRADFIVLDSFVTRQRFLAACVAWAIDSGYLRHAGDEDDEQSKVSSFRLTASGEREFGRKGDGER